MSSVAVTVLIKERSRNLIQQKQRIWTIFRRTTTHYSHCVYRAFESQQAIDRVDLRPSSFMAMDYTVWYSKTLRSSPERQWAPFRAPRLI